MKMNLNVFYNENLQQDMPKYINTHFKDEIKDIILDADEFCKNRFNFANKYSSNRASSTYSFDGEIQWEKTFNGDEEWTFKLNSHKYLLVCANAYLATGDEKYTETFQKHLTHWIDNQKYTLERCKTSWRTIELGDRCKNWIKMYTIFAKSSILTDEFKEKFRDALDKQAKHLFNTYDTHKKLSNWGFIESTGLLCAGIFLDNSSYIDKSLERIQAELLTQVMPDGSHWEQSPSYSSVICSLSLDIITMLENNNIEVPKVVYEKSKAQLYALLYMKKPNHHQVTQGDSDDFDLRDIITKGAYVYKDKVLKFGGYDKIDFKNLLVFGMESLDYNNMEKIMPENLSHALNYSGNYYLRSSFEEDAHYIYFHCGTLGSGHGHADLLHFNISANGQDYLIDSGRGTYVDNELRKYLKSPKAHNTTTVDDKDFTVYYNTWDYSKIANPIKHPFYFGEKFDYIEGSHMGYLDIGVLTNRQIIYIKPDVWVVADNFYTSGEHTYKQYFHFAHDIIIDGNKTICEKNNNKLILTHLTDIDKKIQKDDISYRYDEILQSDTLVTSLKNEGFTSILTVISTDEDLSCENIPVKDYENNEIDKNIASAIKIVKKDITYIVLICHNEMYKQRTLMLVDKYSIYGKVVVITQEADKDNIDILDY